MQQEHSSSSNPQAEICAFNRSESLKSMYKSFRDIHILVIDAYKKEANPKSSDLEVSLSVFDYPLDCCLDCLADVI